MYKNPAFDKEQVMVDSSSEKPQDFAFNTKECGVAAASRTRLRNALLNLRRLYLTKIWGMDIHTRTLISLKTFLDLTYPKGIHIGEGTAINLGSIILTHDMIRDLHLHTRIGRFCAIGARSIILPGLTVGDHSIVGAGTVVTRDVPPNSIVVGNPGRVVRTGIMTGLYGRLTDKGISVKNKSDKDD